MITEAETGNILYRDCKRFGVPVYQRWNLPKPGTGGERIVVYPKRQSSGAKWITNFIEVNYLVPDRPDGKADMVRLHEVERLLAADLHAYGVYDGTPYRYSVNSETDILEDKELKIHYVNARVQFRTMNIN